MKPRDRHASVDEAVDALKNSPRVHRRVQPGFGEVAKLSTDEIERRLAVLQKELTACSNEGAPGSKDGSSGSRANIQAEISALRQEMRVRMAFKP